MISSSLVLHGTGRLGKGAHRDQGATRTTGEKARRTQSAFSAQGGRTLSVQYATRSASCLTSQTRRQHVAVSAQTPVR